MCDTRKEQVEIEKSNLMSEGWVEDHLGILANHYLTLMQVIRKLLTLKRNCLAQIIQVIVRLRNNFVTFPMLPDSCLCFSHTKSQNFPDSHQISPHRKKCAKYLIREGKYRS